MHVNLGDRVWIVIWNGVTLYRTWKYSLIAFRATTNTKEKTHRSINYYQRGEEIPDYSVMCPFWPLYLFQVCFVFFTF